jgi:hypothetical protein
LCKRSKYGSDTENKTKNGKWSGGKKRKGKEST